MGVRTIRIGSDEGVVNEGVGSGDLGEEKRGVGEVAVA